MNESHPQPVLRCWPLLSRECAGDFKIFRVHRSVRQSPTTGQSHSFVGLESPDWVNVVAVTDDGRLLLVDQYRHGTDAFTVEIPGGAVDPGEAPQDAAARELEEETGYRAEELLLLGRVEPNPAFIDNSCWTYLALGCTPTGIVSPDPSEEIVVHTTDLAGFTAMIDDGVIRHSLVVAAHDHLQRALAKRPTWMSLLC